MVVKEHLVSCRSINLKKELISNLTACNNSSMRSDFSESRLLSDQLPLCFSNLIAVLHLKKDRGKGGIIKTFPLYLHFTTSFKSPVAQQHALRTCSYPPKTHQCSWASARESHPRTKGYSLFPGAVCCLRIAPNLKSEKVNLWESAVYFTTGLPNWPIHF